MPEACAFVVAVGKALFFKSNKLSNKVYVLISDGELNEGSTWESLLFACHHRLNNLIIILDNNKIQSMGRVNNIMKLEPIKKKLLAFGQTIQVYTDQVKKKSTPLSRNLINKIKKFEKNI